MTLLTISFFYLITGSSGFFRRKLDPHTENPEFDYCFRIMFRGGIVLFTLGILALVFPSDYWLLTLAPTLGAIIYSIFKKLEHLRALNRG